MIKSYKRDHIKSTYDIHDNVNEDGRFEATLVIPVGVWNGARDEEDIVEMINNWTFPDFCIKNAYYEVLYSNNEEITVRVDVSFDLD